MAGHLSTKTADWPAADSGVPGGGEVTITRPALGETWHGTITSATADGMARVRIHSYTPRGGGPKRRMRHHVTVPLADLERAPRRVTIRVSPEGKALWAEARHRRVRGRFADTGRSGFAEMHGFKPQAGIAEARAAWDKHQWKPKGKPRDVSQITQDMHQTRLALLDETPAAHKEAYGAAAFHLKAAESRMLDRGTQAGQIDQDKTGQAYHRMAEAHQRIVSDVLPNAEPGHYPAAAGLLQRIAGHMQDLDRLMGANPALTRRTLGGFDEVFAHVGEARRDKEDDLASAPRHVVMRLADLDRSMAADPAFTRRVLGFDEAAHAGETRLPWDQDGAVLHYHGSLGVDRGDMPQISGTVAGRYASSAEMIPKFLDRLKARGITVTHERVPASTLKPTQTTGDADTVRRIADEIGRGKDTKPVLTSSDSRVVDGHHQWAAHALADSEGTRAASVPAGVPVIRVHLPASEVLEEARQFASDQGIGNRRTGVAANPEYAKTKTSGGPAVHAETKLFDEGKHPRDGNGHWIDVGHVVHLADGKVGKVTGVQDGGKVEVALHGGGHVVVDPKQINIHGPAGAAPPGARARPGFHGFTEGHAPLTDAAARSDAPKPLSDAEYDARTSHIETVLKGALDSGMATNHVHTLDPAGEVWTPERAAIHKEIVDKMLADAKDVPNEGKGVIAGGLGGAGKGTVLTKHAGIDTSKYMTINPDDVKEELARRGLVPHVEGLTPMEASALVHEESSRVANMAAQRAYAEKKNLIWDITMSSAKSAGQRVSDMRKAGYGDLRGMFVDIPAETSVQRALGRHRRGLEDYRQGKGYGGRYVPPALIRKSAGTGPVSTNRQAFEQLHGKFDGWSMYDNSVNGRAPVHVASGGTAAAAAHPPWTVSGGTAHFHGSLGIDRGEMPQLSGTVNGEYVPASALVPKFMQQMQDRGVPVTHETVPATSLKPAQTSGDIETIQGIAASLRAGEAAKPAIVSSDDRVIDGHHTWAAGVTAGQDVPVIRVGLPAAQVISEMRAFNVAQGIAPRAAGVMANPEYARPAHIFPKDIKAGTKFIVNGVTYTAEADAVPIKNGRIYRVNGLTQDGRPQPINLRESDTVVATARPAEKKQAVRIKKISAA